MNVHKIASLFLLFMLVATGVSASPNKTTYQARIVKPDGYPLEAANVNFNFTILDPTGSCVIYAESYSAVNMQQSGGLISFSLGSGTRSYPASATTMSSVFDNSTVSYSCQTPGIFSPVSTDVRKIVMQFNDGNGWQTLPAMSINAVPYAMYAGKAEDAISFNGKVDTAFVQYSSIPTCVASQALHFNGATFQCVAAGGAVSSTVVSAGDITTALGYTPVNPATVATSFTTMTSSISSLSTSYTTLASSLLNSINGSSSSTQIFSLGVAGISPSIQTSNGTHTFNLPLAASASVTAGLLSNADYVYFSGKMNATSAAIATALGYAPADAVSFSTLSSTVNSVSSSVSSLSNSTAASLTSLTASKVTSSAASIAQVLGYVPANSSASSQWATSGSTISYVAGRVGVGSTNPISNFQVGPTNLTTDYGNSILISGNSNAPSAMGSTRLMFEDRHVSATRVATLVYGGNTFAVAALNSAGTAWMNNGIMLIDTVTADANFTGNLAVGTAGVPITKLDVAGGVRISMESAACSVSYAGTIRYNAGSVEFCNGSSWSAFGVAGAGITSFNGSVSATQTFVRGIAGTQPAFITVNGVHTLNLPYAASSSVAAGLISNADYVSFSNNGTSITTLSSNLSSVSAAANTAQITANAVSTTVATKITSSSASIAQVLGYIPAVSGALVALLADTDLDTKIQVEETVNENKIRFDTAGTERVVIDNNGNVGIGTSSPTSVLSVGGNLGSGYALTANSTGLYGSIIQTSDATPGNSAAFWVRTTPDGGVTATTLFRVQNNGYAGFGVSAPSAVLHLKAGTTSAAPLKFSSGTLLTSPQSGSIEFDGFNFYMTNGAGTRSAIGSSGGSSTFAASGTAAVFNSGNVGVGTSNPARRLDVYAASGSSSPMAIRTNDYVAGSIGSALFFDFGAASGNTYSAISASSGGGGSTNNLILQLSGGYVGIATSQPTQLLDVNGIARVRDWLNVGYAPTTQNAGDLLILNGYNSAKFRMHANNSGGSQPTDGFSIYTDSTNTDIMHQENGYLSLGTSGTEKMRILSGGNVGIGVTNPTAKLHVNGNIKTEFTSQTVYTNNIAINSSSADMAIHYSSAKLHFGSDITSAVTFARDGKVGFGTSAPTMALDISKTNADADLYLRTSNQAYDPSINFNNSASIFRHILSGSEFKLVDGGYSRYYAVSANSGHTFYAPVNGAMLSVTSGGVGIGTTTPNRRLAIEDATNASFSVTSGNHALYGGADTNHPWFGTSTNSDLRLVTSSTEKVRITSAGLVGIGKSVPTSNLHIDTGISTTNYTGIKLENAFKTWTIGNNVPNNYNNIFGIFDGTASRLWINDTGSVGLGGITNPTQKLHVSGSVQVDGDIYGGKYGGTRGIWRFSTADPNFGIFYTEANPDSISFSPNGGGSAAPAMSIYGNNVGIGVSAPTYSLQLALDSAAKPGTSAWTVPSDRRLKDYQGDFTRGLAAMEEIQPIYYNYKKDNAMGLPSDAKFVGIFAQDVKKTIPEAIREKDGYLQVTNDSIFWTMFNAIKELYSKWSDDSQELHREIASVKADNAAKDQKIKDLEERLQKIENALQQAK